MPLAGRVLLSQMLDDIKVEARIKGSDNLNITILQLINEELLAQTERDRFSWLVRTKVPIVPVAGQGDYALPDDFLNVKAVYFARAAELTAESGRVLRHKNDYVERSRDGTEPKFYELIGGQGLSMMISLFPYGGILQTDLIAIDYWAHPNALELTDTFPLPKLYSVIKRKVISRVHIINKDLQAAQLLDKSADDQEARSETSEDNADTQG